MRTLSLTAAALAALIVMPASARQAAPTWHGSMASTQWQGAQAWHGQGMVGRPQMHGGSRWGGKTNGRWSGGWNAPGGWNSYHRPTRGWTLPGYWIAPSFLIGDYASYGLASPPDGYYWSRYYDDAVLTDDNGRVQDSVSGIDWDRGGDGYGAGYADDGNYGAPDRGYGPGPGADYGPGPGYAPDGGYDDCGPGRYHRDHGGGVAGAVVGGVAGGFAGHAIAGRHDKTFGTVAGAAVGAGAGYAIGHSGDRGHYEADCRGAGYAPPPGPGPMPGPGGWRGAPPPIAYQSFPNGTQVWSATTYSGDGRGYIRGNFWYPPAVTTTVTVSTQPVVTTTTTEYVTEKTYAPARKVWRRKVWHKPRQCTCRCTTTCR
jgi:Ni/Co efflux regulator RcnB